MTRKVSIIAAVHGMDFENFGANERANGIRHAVAFLEDGGGPESLMDAELRWGGECRGEIHLRGESNNGVVFVQGDALLFEADSESTDDLDGRQSFTLSVGKSETVNHSVRVTNTDENAQDFCHWDLAITNIIVE